jgi:membrane dipeptidase
MVAKGGVYLQIRDSAQALHRESIVVDAHCDTITALMKESRSLGELSSCGHIDLPRLKLGGIKVQFFAAFIAPEYKYTALTRTLEIIDLFYREAKLNEAIMLPVKDNASLDRSLAEGKIAAFLTVEGGEALMGELYVLRMLYRLGVRSLTLTWNGRNDLACGVGEGSAAGGLSIFGRAVVREMNSLGMLIDVSHLAEKGFWEVMELSAAPVIASHSNCQKLCRHKRNLTDEQILSLKKAGGVIGLSFVPQFISAAGADLDSFLDHVDHIAALAGVDCIGLGSDFDGIDAAVPGLEDCSRLPCITEGLLQRGYSEEDIKKFLGGNFLRVIRKILR